MAGWGKTVNGIYKWSYFHGRQSIDNIVELSLKSVSVVNGKWTVPTGEVLIGS